MYIPWDISQKQIKKAQKKQFEDKEINHLPEKCSLDNLTIYGDLTQQQLDDELVNYRNTQIGATGILFEGIWGGQLTYQEIKTRSSSESVYIEKLYWTKVNNKTAFRLGTNTNGYSDLTNIEFTGLNAGYSNKSILPHLTYNDSHTSTLFSDSYKDVLNRACCNTSSRPC